MISLFTTIGTPRLLVTATFGLHTTIPPSHNHTIFIILGDTCVGNTHPDLLKIIWKLDKDTWPYKSNDICIVVTMSRIPPLCCPLTPTWYDEAKKVSWMRSKRLVILFIVIGI